MRLDMEEAARMAHLDMKLDVLIDSQARIVDVYAGDLVAEHRAALDRRARQIWMTPMQPADIYVLYPGQGSERHLESSFFMRIEGAELGVKEDGIILMALSAAGGWASTQADGHRQWVSADQTAELFKGGTEALARAMARREVNVRTCSALYTARRVLDRRKTFLVCDGIGPQDAAEFGFRLLAPRASRMRSPWRWRTADQTRGLRSTSSPMPFPLPQGALWPGGRCRGGRDRSGRLEAWSSATDDRRPTTETTRRRSAVYGRRSTVPDRR